MDSQAPVNRSLSKPRTSRRFIAMAATLAVLSVLISLGGSWLGSILVLAGHTEDRTPREIVVGNNVLAVPSNAVRFPEARVDGVTERLDLYMHWPDLEGYTAETRNAFNNATAEKLILFLAVEEAAMSLDMTGRLEPIYRKIIEPDGRDLAGGLTAHTFKETSGYRDEELIVGSGATPFVARCMTGKAAAGSLAPCERDVRLGDELSLTYRFPREMLAQSGALDQAVMKRAKSFLRTPG
jgi:hypothetical protein